MKILTVVGARPQFIKASMLSMAFHKHPKIEEMIVHTGQHYDYNMSDIFFEQLKLPKADYHLETGSGSHGEQTAKMLVELEKLMISVQPNIVVVFGDTNSTVAGSLAAAKLDIPIAHVEAGLRSFNKKMPEEVNRIITDHLSDVLFCPSETAVNNLKREGISKGVYLTGDIMFDTLTYFKPHALEQSTILEDLKLEKQDYYLATVHRAENTDDYARLKQIFNAIHNLDKNVVIPLHPRTKNKLIEFKLSDMLSLPHIKLVEPLNYFDMLVLASNARAILTDSGGLQKEAYMLQVPCITLRDETEWVETVESGWNHVIGANTQAILAAISKLKKPKQYPLLYREGAADHIANILLKRQWNK